MQKISPEHDRVLRRVDRVDPSGRDEEGVAGRKLNPEAIFDDVAEKNFALEQKLRKQSL